MSATLCELESPPPTAEKRRATQRDLWRRYSRSGPGSELENSMVEQYLPLVKTVVGRLAMTLPSHANADDLYSAGLVGLLNALRRYNPNNGTSFETYARVRIRGAVFDELRRMDWVPRSVHEKARKIEKTMQELMQSEGEVPTSEQMAKAMKMGVEEYEELLEEIRPTTFIRLDSAQGDGRESGSLHEGIADDAQTNPERWTAVRELAALIMQRLKNLPDMQRKVLALYYFEDMRLREIAEAFGVTESRICQIHSQAVLAIKALLRKEDPEVFSHPL
jgi:RNA polymerase sigma factor for flagellar operon FliA